MSISGSKSAAWAAGLGLAACSLAPRYTRPPVPIATAYQEDPTWKPAKPGDDALRGDWWALFNDRQLDAYEVEASSANQNVAAAYDDFMAARAVVKELRSGYFPAVSEGATVQRQRAAPFIPAVPGATFSEYALPFDASWEPDLWGKLRNSVAAGRYAAQQSAADLQNMKLSVQGELAVDYFSLRGQDSMIALLKEAVAVDSDTLALTRVLDQAGLGSDQAVSQAEDQLQTALAEADNAGIQRAQYEHAIAVLLGRAPEGFSVPAAPLALEPPPLPAGVPSQLLERRPDIAAAERAMAAANAQIGVARAAYFPDITLSASAGWESLLLSRWLTWPSRVWAVGGSLSEALFDAGLRSATVAQYRAQYDQTVSQYRQTVLAALEQVEDDLAARRILESNVREQQLAVDAAQRDYQEERARYQAGLDPYLAVLAGQSALIAARQASVSYRTQQLTACVQLIEALGGGWDVSRLPQP